jgi:hypothetical protein
VGDLETFLLTQEGVKAQAAWTPDQSMPYVLGGVLYQHLIEIRKTRKIQVADEDQSGAGVHSN